MKILGIDYGRKRLGLAVCNELRVACPRGVILHVASRITLEKIAEVIEDEEIDEIVVGLPKNMNDSLGFMAQEAEKFADSLRCRFPLPVTLWDERLTSWEAERIMLDAGVNRKRREGMRDAVAAALILQSYVECRHALPE